MSSWFNVEVIDKKSGAASCGLYMYAKKSHDGENVVVHNGRHFIKTYTKEEAKKTFKINSKLAAERQAAQEDNFQYYLYY